MKLYSWQRECLQAWEQRHCRGIAHVVTGAGKTFLALSAMDRYLENHPDAFVKIVVPTIPLALQWQTALLHHVSSEDLRPGFFGGGVRDKPDRRVMIYIINSARTSLSDHVRKAFSLGRHVLLVCDECHHYQSPQNRRIFGFTDSPFFPEGLYASLGLSATPLGTGDDEILLRAIGPVVYRYDFSAALADGIVSPFSVCETAVSFLPEEQSAYSALSLEIGICLRKLYKACPYLEQLGGNAFLKAVSKLARAADMDPSNPAAAYQLKCWERKEISVLAESRLLCALSLIRLLPDYERILVFSERIAQAEALARLIRRKLGNICSVYHSEMTQDARKRNMDAFRTGQVRILVSCRCLDEGLDVPDASVALVLSASAVPRQRVQRLGRILRRAEGKAAASLYYLYIRESADDQTFLPGIDAARTVSLQYSASENDFSNELYEYAATQLLNEKKAAGYSPQLIKEYRRCLIEGLPRTDYLLSPATLSALRDQAVSPHERNYWLAMKQLSRYFC